jgi:hypothetical protein
MSHVGQERYYIPVIWRNRGCQAAILEGLDYPKKLVELQHPARLLGSML